MIIGIGDGCVAWPNQLTYVAVLGVYSSVSYFGCI